MMDNKKVITVFGSSRPEEGHADYVEAVELGRALATAGFAVCTGGKASPVVRENWADESWP